jgi:hypothetical protein
MQCRLYSIRWAEEIAKVSDSAAELMICPCCGLADETHNDLYCRIDNFGTCSA